MSQPVRLGPIYFLSCAIILLFTFVALWFGFGDPTRITIGFLVMALGGWAVIAVSRRVAIGGSSTASLMLTGIAFLAILVESSVAQTVFSAAYSVPGEGIIINVLFGGYEENLFLALILAGKSAELPSLFIIVLSCIVFVPLHAFSQPDDMGFNVAALMVRFTLSSLTTYTRLADPSFGGHMLWNGVMSL
jgi:hypothetical protein